MNKKQIIKEYAGCKVVLNFNCKDKSIIERIKNILIESYYERLDKPYVSGAAGENVKKESAT